MVKYNLADYFQSMITEDPNHPELKIGQSEEGQNKVYLVMKAEERAKGFVRPVRDAYVHTVCGTQTRMALSIAETYARDPNFYSHTYCCRCRKHTPVAEFYWDNTTEFVGS